MDPQLHVAATLLLAVLYPLLPLNGRRTLLLVASYGFYGAISLGFVPYLLVVSLVSFFGGIFIEKRRDPTWPIATTIAVLLAPLIFFKYWEAWFGDIILPGITVSSLSFGGQGSVLIPVGLSFYTFQAIGYVIDVRRGADADRNVVRFLTFKAFFPQLLAGPIERYRSLCPQLWSAPVPPPSSVGPAVLLMLWGLALKVIIGDRLGVSVDEAYIVAQPGWRDAVMVTAGFTLQVFADFAGYSLIAVGSAKLFGVDLIYNFKQPFFSHNLIEFWQRWHISLTRWIGDYLYRPIGRTLWRWTKGKRFQSEFLTAIIVWIVMGLWHGPTLQFVIFGLSQALAMQAIKLLGPDRPAKLPWWRLALGGLATFAFVSITFGLIRTPDLSRYATMMGALVTGQAGHAPIIEGAIALVALCIMMAVEATQRFRPVTEVSRSPVLVYSAIFLLFLLVVFFGYDQSRAFVYFRY
ncbi:MBOAT family protein [Tardiphaga alba]|uniref:Probable alginate O-acetylase AlgI n=1 Tax=Tardiphaga alba TaxID=340268 RepID=A0ABX8A6N2_9BRAD|nr:MBOAT family protein [Tardiphaga alba]QUS39092.1 MBOAT family protein [Tardiphaga alba]